MESLILFHSDSGSHVHVFNVSGGWWWGWGVAGSSEEGVLNASGIQSLFSMRPGCWKAAESSNTDSLPHALHGKSSEIKGFV